MITRLKISNFRSLGPDVEVHLGPLVAFVGRNASGKSNLLDAVRFVGDVMHHGLEAAISERGGIGAVRRWTAGKPCKLSMDVEVTLAAGGHGFLSFTLDSHKTHEFVVTHEEAWVVPSTVPRDGYERRSGQWVTRPDGLFPELGPMQLALPLLAGDERFRPLGDALRRCVVYSIFPDVLRGTQKPDPSRPMDSHGSNWVSVLKELGPDARHDLIAGLQRLTGEIDDLGVRQLGGHLVAQFRHGLHGKARRPRWFDSDQESDGTLRVAGILTALLQEPRPFVVGVEEPELTVHPGAVALVVDYLRQASPASQVLLTTHSPELLEELEADEIRTVFRERGVTRIAALAPNAKAQVEQGLRSLGELQRAGDLTPEKIPMFSPDEDRSTDDE